MLLCSEKGSGVFVVAVPEERWDELQEALGGWLTIVVGTTGGDRFEMTISST